MYIYIYIDDLSLSIYINILYGPSPCHGRPMRPMGPEPMPRGLRPGTLARPMQIPGPWANTYSPQGEHHKGIGRAI